VVVWPACFQSMVSTLHSTVDMWFFAASASMPGALNPSGGRKKQVLWPVSLSCWVSVLWNSLFRYLRVTSRRGLRWGTGRHRWSATMCPFGGDLGGLRRNERQRRRLW
jgi:hypothetical protein